MPRQPEQTPQRIYQETTSLGFWGTTWLTPGPLVTGMCPVCQVTEACFHTSDLSHKIRFLVLPVWTFRKSVATCGNCEVQFRVRDITLDQLTASNPQHLAEKLVPERYQPWTAAASRWTLLAVGSCSCPLVGLIFCLLAWRQTRHRKGGLAIAVIIASGFVSLLFRATIVVGLIAWDIRSAMQVSPAVGCVG